MRELDAGDDVAHGVDVRQVRAQVLVGDHEAAVHLDALLLVAAALGDRAAADGHEHQVAVDDGAALDGHLDAGVGPLDLLEELAGVELDAPLAERALQLLRGGGVLGGDEPGEALDDLDLDAQGPPGGGELGADDAAADDDGLVRQLGEVERVLGGDDPLAVDLQTGEGLGVGAGREDDVPAGDGPAAVDLDRVRADELAGAVDDLDLVGLEQALEALVHLGDDAVLVLVDAGHVDALEVGQDAELLGVAGVVGDLAGVEQRLRGDAAAVQTGAADLVLLDQGHGHAQVRRAERAGVTAAAATQDHYVVSCVRVAHWSPHLTILKVYVNGSACVAANARVRVPSFHRSRRAGDQTRWIGVCNTIELLGAPFRKPCPCAAGHRCRRPCVRLRVDTSMVRKEPQWAGLDARRRVRTARWTGLPTTSTSGI